MWGKTQSRPSCHGEASERQAKGARGPLLVSEEKARLPRSPAGGWLRASLTLGPRHDIKGVISCGIATFSVDWLTFRMRQVYWTQRLDNISLAVNYGYSRAELRKIENLLRKHLLLLRERWDAFCGGQSYSYSA